MNAINLISNVGHLIKCWSSYDTTTYSAYQVIYKKLVQRKRKLKKGKTLKMKQNYTNKSK